MNFLIAHLVAPESSGEESNYKDVPITPKPASTLEGLIEEETDLYSKDDDAYTISDGVDDTGSSESLSTSKIHGSHTDVSEDDGWITIPNKDLPENWATSGSILELRSLDRSFIFPGEQIHILVCLSAPKQESEIITPFRVAAALSKNGKSLQNQTQHIETANKTLNPGSPNGVVHSMTEETSGQNMENELLSPRDDISATEFLLRMECHKQQTESRLKSFRNSSFFVRITEADEQLCSKQSALSSRNSKVGGERSYPNGVLKVPKSNAVSSVIDKSSFDANTSGGMARDTVRCYSLSNGDIVVLLEVNTGVNNLKDPVLEVFQFEKYQASNSAFEDHNNLLDLSHEDPYQGLLDWLLPLDRTSSARPLSPPLSATISQKVMSSSGSQIFSFGNFRSYSMPTLSHVTASAKPAVDPDDDDPYSPEKLIKSKDTGNEGLLSFRGISLEPQRFSSHCSLEGMYLPGQKWRRKLEIIQPIEICSFATECNTEDMLCVQIKNVSPAHTPNIIIFLDAITIVSEEVPKGGPPLSLPIASIETGNGHSLPNLALRRDEEHSFILKPATRANKDHKSDSEMVRHPRSGAAASINTLSSTNEGMMAFSNVNQFVILVSCRCNHSESKLFFKHLTDWRPRIASDLMVSIESESHKQTDNPIPRTPQLPIKVLTLRATNLTSEDLTFTVLAPEPSVSPFLSLSSSPKTPTTVHTIFHDFLGGNRDKSEISVESPSSAIIATKFPERFDRVMASSSVGQQIAIMPDIIFSNNSGLTHLWLQSAVPLGSIPARSSATVKLELLPLTHGIIDLDTLHIAVKEKDGKLWYHDEVAPYGLCDQGWLKYLFFLQERGYVHRPFVYIHRGLDLSFIPENPLKIHSFPSIATGNA